MNIRRLNTRFFLIPVCLVCLSFGQLSGQGFIRQYPFFSWPPGGAQAIFPKADGSFRLTAVTYPDFGIDGAWYWLDIDAGGQMTDGDTLHVPTTQFTDVLLLENGDYLRVLDINHTGLEVGTSQWNIQIDPNPPPFLFYGDVVQTPDGGFLLQGSGGTLDSGYLFKISATGDLLWQKGFAFGPAVTVPLSPLLASTDNGCLAGITTADGKEALSRFDQNGNMLWTYTPNWGSLNLQYETPTYAINAGGEVFVLVNTLDPATGVYDSLRLQKLSAAGSFLHETDILNATGIANLRPKLVFPLSDGGAVLVGEQYLLNSWTNFVFRIHPDGDIAWFKPLNVLTDAFPADFADGKELSDGSLVLYGYQYPSDELFLIKMSPQGVIYPHTLTGTIARDSTFNCTADAFDPPLAGWVVRAEGNGQTRFAASDAAGHYTMTDVDTGAYQIVLTPPSYLWQVCNDSVQQQFTGSDPQTHTLDFQVQSLYDCPLMQVDIAVPFLRRCFENVYSLHYCNAGNQTTNEARITVQFDPLLEILSASAPYTQNGQTLTFELGTVAAGHCGSIYIHTKVDCDAIFGQALCATAHIFPDTICAPTVPGWSGARVEVSAQCEGDSVRFRIQNTGSAPMPQALDFIIVDDHVITRHDEFQLGAGAVHTETVTADGSTWRLIAEQEPGYPFGPRQPSVGVEACTSTPAGGFTTGMLNMFANYSGNPFEDTDCHPVIGAYDPNDKQAFPIGAEAAHFIEQNQPIDYLIRFQNTGTDTAFTVVLRDTLSPWLDPATLRPGAASHPYTWNLGGAGILTVVFADIMLPDSNVNEPASHGFIQFHIDQLRDNPLGARIENRASIYFDFNAPVLTNTVFHTVGRDFLPTSTKTPAQDIARLLVQPNPATAQTRIFWKGDLRPGQRLLLHDGAGRLVREFPVTGPVIPLQRGREGAGLYWVELREGNRTVAVGRLVWVE